jgi:DNA gyrase subunit A
MASKQKVAPQADFTRPAQHIFESELASEVSDSFLEYAYTVIGGRALPDARDGLKPVHRRILFTMNEMGLVPTHAYVKCGRVVGEVMGRLHPHGDSAIYEAMVRMAQDFSLSVPFVDGHGNFGSLDSGAAAPRYTEARMSKAALGMVTSVHENSVDMTPNYDGSLLEPSVLPAVFPNLLVNGAEGIAVGMATKMAPHNLEEAVAAARLLLAKPKTTLNELMAIIPGPDFPGGCEVVTGEGAREAFESGKGTVTMRAVARVEPLEGSRGRNQIIVSALPFGTGPEKIIDAIKKNIADKRISFVSDIIDLSEGDELALHIELKTGVNPEQALASLYSLTPLQTNFAISNLALVDGQPRTLGLIQLLTVFLDFRKEVVLRRSEFRRGKAQARLHLVDGLLIILDGLDEAIRIIRGSKNTIEAKAGLMKKFALDDDQATYILDTPLRRLTALEVDALRAEKKALEATIADLTDIIENPKRLVKVVDTEMADFIAANPSPRKSVLLDAVADVPVIAAASGVSGATSATSTHVDNTEYTWHLTAAGLLKNIVDPKKDVVVASATTTGHMLLLCADGVAVKVPCALMDGMKAEIAASRKSPVVGIAPMDANVIMGTRNGVVKALKPDWPTRGDEFPYIGLETGDTVMWAGTYSEDDLCVFITTDASLLRFPAALVRPQGRSGGGMAGIKLSEGTRVAGFKTVNEEHSVVTISDAQRGKTTPLSEYPGKGRATGGVRCHKFLKGETELVTAQLVGDMVYADNKGKTTKLPAAGRRDGAGA